MSTTQKHIDLVESKSAHNYHPLPIVIAQAQGVWVHDVEGKRYMDMLAAYSAVNFGHRHPDLVAACKEQLDKVTLTSRAFHNDQFGPFCQELAQLCKKDAVLAMNTGAEAVETALKTARKWGYQKKGVPQNHAEIIVCEGNFHGRTTTIISFSSDEQARQDFGPYTPGFVRIPYGDAQALRKAITPHTVGFLFEPIQGEGGVVIPPNGYLREVRDICTQNNILMIADEIQSGLGRTGKTFACDHENVVPDIYILGKALGGGILPISAIVANHNIMDVFKPGDHGSTFGGNPLACAVARKVVALLRTESLQKHALEQGDYAKKRLQDANLACVKEIRGRGLWLGLELHTKARPYCEQLMQRGLLCKETHVHTIRLAPPLVISPEELQWALDTLLDVLKN
jgi:ornithine--oxo-acid transaminase